MSRIAISEITTAEWSFEEDVKAYDETEGVDGIGVWREEIEDIGVEEAATIIADSGLEVSSLTYAGGFITDFETNITDAKQALRDAEQLSAPVLLILGGPRIGVSTDEGNRRVRKALEELAPVAEETGVTLGLEPIHPMQVTVFSTVVTLEQARELVADIPSTSVVFDTWNTWWDPNVESSIDQIGDDIGAVHVADWDHESDDPSNRVPPGGGVAPLGELLSVVGETGYDEWYEIELFTDQYTSDEYDTLLESCVDGTLNILPDCHC